MLREAADAIEELQKPKWISVKDQLPKPDKDVLLCYEWTGRSGTVYREVELCSLSAFNETTKNFRAISWMPLPEPYRKEQNDN